MKGRGKSIRRIAYHLNRNLKFDSIRPQGFFWNVHMYSYYIFVSVSMH